MKRAISMFLFCVIILSLFSCGDSNELVQIKQDETDYSYIKDDLDTGYEETFNFQYVDNTLYGVTDDYSEEQGYTYKINKIDHSSGKLTLLFEVGSDSDFGEYQSYTVDTEGGLWVLFKGEEEEKSTNFTIAKIVDGSVESQVEIKGLSKTLDSYTIFVSSDGRFYLTVPLDKVFVYDLSGNLITEIEYEGIFRTFLENQGQVYINYYDAYGFYVSKINADDAVLEPYTTVKYASSSDFCFVEAQVGEYCYYDDNGVQTVDGEGNRTQLIAWTDYGWGVNYPERIFVTDEGDILCCMGDSIAKMMRVSAEEGDQRQTLTLAAFDAGEALKYLVADFNSTNKTYMISIVDYNEYNTETDPYAGLTKLNTEIIGGNPPDMIDLRNIDAEQYMTMGILVDLYPYLDEDPDLERDGFLDNVLNAMGDGEKLYGVTTTFRLNTVLAKTEAVDLDNWNFQGLKKLLESNPEAFLGGTKTKLLELACTYMQENFVDWEKGGASFDADEFISFLEACNTLPEETEIIDIYDLYFMETENNSVYAAENVSSFNALKDYEDAWKTDVSIVGYPESGTTIGLRMFVGMLSASENKDAAWSFLRMALLPDAQMEEAEFVMGFPISKVGFERGIEQALTPSDSDVAEMIVDGTTGESVEVSSANPTQEQVDKIAEAAKSADKLSSNNTIIKDIVLEEASDYFAGNKTAEEAAKIIQNRVSTYVNEQKS